MITNFVAFLVSLTIAAVLTLIVRNRAHAYGLLDQASNSRKIHAKPIPRLGGIAIVLGTFAPLVALLVVDTEVGRYVRGDPALVRGLMFGGVAVAILGLYDDLRGSGARVKFIFQFAIAGLLYALDFRITNIANPFGTAFNLGWLSLPFTLLWVVGVINAMNLIDGLDGLAGGVAFFGVLTNFLLAAARGDVLMCVVMAALGGAILGFLVFNFNPASIFMGDTGSMFLGFVLAAASIKVNAKSGTAVAMLVPIIALGFPIMDTLLAMSRRAILGRPMFSADKEHIHHRLMSRGALSHRHAVLVLYGLCILFAATALALSYANSAQSAMLLAAISIVVVVLMRRLGYLNLNQANAVGATRRRNMQLRSLVKELEDALTKARSFQEMWNAVRPLSEALESATFELRLEHHRGDVRDDAVFRIERPNSGTAFPVEVIVELDRSMSKFGELKVSWTDGRPEIQRDEELALELIGDALAISAERLETLEKQSDRSKVITLRR